MSPNNDFWFLLNPVRNDVATSRLEKNTTSSPNLGPPRQKYPMCSFDQVWTNTMIVAIIPLKSFLMIFSTAPEECPLSDGNIVKVSLFIPGNQSLANLPKNIWLKSNIHPDPRKCMEACQIDLKCNFYKVHSLFIMEYKCKAYLFVWFQHYPSLEGRPEQCFFFDTCGKLVSRLLFYTADLGKPSFKK